MLRTFVFEHCTPYAHNLIKNKLHDLDMLKTLLRVEVFCHLDDCLLSLTFVLKVKKRY